MIKQNTLAVLILAAGTSSRLGEPKQLVKFKEKTLLQIAIENALKVSSNVFVVLGEKAELIQKEISAYKVSVLINKNYKQGLSSSIVCGISSLKKFDKTLIMLCDQPFINFSHLKKLIEKAEETNKLVCSYYKKDIAVPAVFPKEFYFKLLDLKGDKGAKAFIKQNSYEFVCLSDDLAFDVDTKADKNFLQQV